MDFNLGNNEQESSSPKINISEKIRNGYYFFEDKWYDLLDKIEPKVPVYKVVDPIDEVIPSFILFLLILFLLFLSIGYLLHFASPYTMIFTTYDSTNNNTLSGVELEGIIGDQIFEEKTNSKGKSELDITGRKKNTYEMLFTMFFGSEEENFLGNVSAKKQGYISLKKVDIEPGDQQELYLSPLPKDEKFGDEAFVELYDLETNEKIIDDTKLAYVKFKCRNNNMTEKTIKDKSDGELDGKFTLNAPNCNFYLTYVTTPGYQTKEPYTTINAGTTKKINLDKAQVSKNGTANIWVENTNGDKLNGIEINFSGEKKAITDSLGFATKTLQEGTYTITIFDENYYSITAEDNITIEILAGETTTQTITLTKKDPALTRKIFVKVIDSNSMEPVNNAKIRIYSLSVDSNLITNVSPNGGLMQAGRSGNTDENGLFSSANYSTLDEGKLLLIIDKSRYLLKYHLPTLKLTTDKTYETITIDLQNATNSGNGLIKATGGDNNVPLDGVNSYLKRQLIINGIPALIAYNSKDTNSDGFAFFDRLSKGNYYGEGAYRNQVVKSHLKSLDVNETTLFNLHFPLDLASIKIRLKNQETEEIITNGIVKSYKINENGTRELYETLTKTSNEHISSKGYFLEGDFEIIADANGFVRRNLIINSDNPLVNGINEYVIGLYENNLSDCADCNDECLRNDLGNFVCVYFPQCDENKFVWNTAKNDLICSSICDGQWLRYDDKLICYPKNHNYSPDGKVAVFFENIFNDLTNSINGTNPVNKIDTNKNYFIKINTIYFDESYKNLYSMTRFEKSNIQSIKELSGFNNNKIRKDAFTCTTKNKDGDILRDENYYFPTCSTQGVNLQSGFNWMDGGNLTYSSINEIKITGDNNEILNIDFRGMSTDTNKFSETGLVNEKEVIGGFRQEGVFIEIDLENNEKLEFDLEDDDLSGTFGLISNEEKELKIKISNQGDADLPISTNIYSHVGHPNNFNNSSTGTILFDNNTSFSKNLIINDFENEEFSLNLINNQANTTNYLVIKLDYDNLEKLIFITLTTPSQPMGLDAEFISGFENPPINGEVSSPIKTPEIQRVEILIDENCDAMQTNGINDDLIEETFILNSGEITSPRFEKIVETGKAYKSGIDCAWINVYPSENQSVFAPLINQKVLAGPYNSMDPSLACIQIREKTENKTDIDLDWGRSINVEVANECEKEVALNVETGLVCLKENNNPCSEIMSLPANAKTTIRITGKNVSYDETKQYANFTDVLGIFPVYVKAKFIDNSFKKYSLADEMTIHLKNPNQCFSISNDDFDFENSNELKFEINSHCQDILINSYFIPKTTINSFGYDITSTKPIETNFITINPKLIIFGGEFDYVESEKNVEIYNEFQNSVIKNLPETNIESIDPNLNKYSVTIDFNIDNLKNSQKIIDWNCDYLQLIIEDLEEESKPFGAKIDGNIILNYDDGSKKEFYHGIDIDLTDFTCPSSPSVGSGNHCHYSYAARDNFEADQNLKALTTYIDFSENQELVGKITSIDINLIGNSDTNNLSLVLGYHANLIEKDIIPTINEDETYTTVDLGSYTFAPVQTTKTFLIDLDELTQISKETFLELNNPKMYIDSNNQQVKIWISGNNLYAKYVGENYNMDDDEVLNRTLNKTFGSGINYSIVSVEDFVSTQNKGLRTISGDHS